MYFVNLNHYQDLVNSNQIVFGHLSSASEDKSLLN